MKMSEGRLVDILTIGIKSKDSWNHMAWIRISVLQLTTVLASGLASPGLHFLIYKWK